MIYPVVRELRLQVEEKRRVAISQLLHGDVQLGTYQVYRISPVHTWNIFL